MTWALVIGGFVLLVILHEFGHFAVAKAVGMRVEKFSLFFPPTLVSKKVGETAYAIGAIPAGGYVKISGMNPDEDLPEEVRPRAYYAQPVWKRVAVIAAGPIMNVLLALVLLFVYYAAIGQPDPPVEPVVADTERGYPAHRVLKDGDRLLAVDGVRGAPEKLSKRIQARRCAGKPVDGCKATEPVELLVERDGRRATVSVTPVYDHEARRMRIGFAWTQGPREPLPAGEAAENSATAFWRITKQTVSLPVRLFEAEKRKELTTVVGISKVAHDTILTDIAEAVVLLAIVSLSLAIVNLFPFLPLDGGHIFWASVEKLRGRPVPFSTMERASYVGFLLVIFVFMIGLSNDIDRLSGEGFGVR